MGVRHLPKSRASGTESLGLRQENCRPPGRLARTGLRRDTSASQKTCAFYVNELSIDPCMCYTRRVSVITVTGLPFDQMEPSCSMQTRLRNPVRTPKSERDFPNFWIEFLCGVLWLSVMTDWWWIIISNILPLSECILDYSFKFTLNHQGRPWI